MAKKSQADRLIAALFEQVRGLQVEKNTAIDRFEARIAGLHTAIDAIEQQRRAKKPRSPKVAEMPAKAAAGL